MAEAIWNLPETDVEPGEGLDEEMRRELERRMLLIDRLGIAFAEKRSMAIDARRASGIEDLWLEDEAFYAGFDEANAFEVGGMLLRKSNIEIGTREAAGTRSTLFVNITRAYCDAASARVADMLLPTDDRAFSIKPTPVPDLAALCEGTIPPHIEKHMLAELGNDPERFEAAKAELFEAAKHQAAQARMYADRAQQQIDDWLTEANFHAEGREVINDMMKAGCGVLKGPVPVEHTRVAYKGGQIRFEKTIKPASMRVDYWNCFPAAGCGDDIQSGDCHFERGIISGNDLRRLLGKDGYIDFSIEACLREGPMVATREWDRTEERLNLKGLTAGSPGAGYEIWYAYGYMTAAELEAVELWTDDLTAFAKDRPRQAVYPVQMEIVNNHVIKAQLSLLESGRYPYNYIRYQKIPGLPWAFGVARHVRPSQRMILAAIRNMMDNAGLSGGPMWVANPNVIDPIDNVWELRARKGHFARSGATAEEIKNAFIFINLDVRQEELEKIIMLGMRFAEEASGLPMLLQGQQGDATKTKGGMEILNNNGSTVLRRLAKTYDDDCTEPHIQAYYEWLLLHHDDDTCKGEFIIDARGSTALVEREIQANSLIELWPLAKDPTSRLDPTKVAEALVRARRLAYEDLRYTDAEWQGVVERLAAAGQQGDPRVQIAQMQIEARAQEQQLQREFQQALKALDLEADAAVAQYEQAMKALDMGEAEKDRAVDLKKHGETLRANMAALALKMRAMYELSPRGNPGRLAAPTEPAGRAPAGQAFQA